MAITFTQAALGKLAGTTGSRMVIPDPKTAGLRAELREGGTLAFYVYRWSPTEQKPIRYKLGVFPEMSVDTARKLAAPKISAIVNGENPAAVKRAKRGEPTLKELFNHWLEMHAKPHKKTWKDDERQFNKYLASCHDRKLSSIDKSEVQLLHAKIGKDHGKTQANRVLALLRALFNRASDMGFKGTNPAAKVKTFKETSRDRFLQPDELPRFFKALQEEQNETQRDFFLLALFTGARRSNVAAMRWADIDLSQASWRIPETKAGRVQYLPLAAPAVAILTRRKAVADGNEWVLPSYGKAGHIVEVKSAWKRIIDRAGLSDIRPHDLRRTLGSYMVVSGASLSIIGAAMDHSQPSTTAVYARLTTTAVADGITKAVELIEATGKPKTTKESK